MRGSAALRLLMLAGLATPLACMAPVRLYAGPERPPDEVAAFEVDRYTRIREVDGRPLDTRRIEMLGGPPVELRVETRRRSMRDYAVLIACRLRVPAEPGTVLRLEHAPSEAKAAYYRAGVFEPAEAGYRLLRRRHDEPEARAAPGPPSSAPPERDAAALVGRCRYGVEASCRATSDRAECADGASQGRDRSLRLAPLGR